MTWQELQNQALHLPIDQRWYLVQALLTFILTLLVSTPLNPLI